MPNIAGFWLFWTLVRDHKALAVRQDHRHARLPSIKKISGNSKNKNYVSKEWWKKIKSCWRLFLKNFGCKRTHEFVSLLILLIAIRWNININRDKERNCSSQKCTRHSSLQVNANNEGIQTTQKGHWIWITTFWRCYLVVNPLNRRRFVSNYWS